MAAGYDCEGTTAELRIPKVKARVVELQAESAKLVSKTVGSLVADLDEAIALARKCRAPAAMIAGTV